MWPVIHFIKVYGDFCVAPQFMMTPHNFQVAAWYLSHVWR